MFGTTINVGELMKRFVPDGKVVLPFGVLSFPKPPRFRVSEDDGIGCAIWFVEGCEPRLLIDGPGWLDVNVAIKAVRVSSGGKSIVVELDGLPDPRINLEW